MSEALSMSPLPILLVGVDTSVKINHRNHINSKTKSQHSVRNSTTKFGYDLNTTTNSVSMQLMYLAQFPKLVFIVNSPISIS